MATPKWQPKAKDIANVWTVTLDNPHVGAVLTITINGNDYSYTITQADMDTGEGDEAAGIGAVVANVVSGFNALEGLPEFVELTASGTSTIILTMDVAGKPTTVSASVSSAGSAQNEVQTLSATVTPTSGNYTLTYDGETTASIAYNANAATIEAALEALSNVASGDITVAGGPLGTDITFTFDGTGTTESTNVKTIAIADVDLDASAYTGTLAIANTTHGAGAATTFSASETTAATGRNHWNNADNWSTGSVPANSDDVYIEGSGVPIKYGLAQSSVTLASLNINNTDQDFFIGLPDTNQDAGTNENPILGEVTAYAEFRAQELAISATTITIDSDCTLLRINTGSNQTTVNVARVGGEQNGVPALRLAGGHTSNAYYVAAGSVGIAYDGASTATIDALGITGDRAIVRCGAGVTWSTATITHQAGTLYLASNWQTINQFGGAIYNQAAATGTTLTQRGGVFYQQSTGTLGTADISGTFDCSRNAKAKTTTNVTIRAKGKLLDPNGSHTETNGIDQYSDDVTITKPLPITRTYSAV